MKMEHPSVRTLLDVPPEPLSDVVDAVDRNGAAARNAARKQRVRHAFDQADAYDENAFLQKQVARYLGAQIVRLGLNDDARILEVGCGTGFLAEAVLNQLRRPDWLMTDIAPAMVNRCRLRFRHERNFRFALLDGENPKLPKREAPFDLVCSNLAAQWFADLPTALERLFAFVKPGGALVVSTLADGSLAEWVEAHSELGYVAGTPHYPGLSTLGAIELQGSQRQLDERRFLDRHANGLTFLRSLRAIGAGTPRDGHRPLCLSEMRKVIRQFEAKGASVTYHVAICSFTRCEL